MMETSIRRRKLFEERSVALSKCLASLRVVNLHYNDSCRVVTTIAAKDNDRYRIPIGILTADHLSLLAIIARYHLVAHELGDHDLMGR